MKSEFFQKPKLNRNVTQSDGFVASTYPVCTLGAALRLQETGWCRGAGWK